MSVRKFLFGLLLVVAVPAAFLCLNTRAVPQGTPPRAAGEGLPLDPGVRFDLKGMNTCAGRSCHGRATESGGVRIQNDEFTKFLRQDKHAEAYRVLFSEQGQLICKNLGILPRDKRCLACHTTPVSVMDEQKTIKFSEEGVSCEACHGAAKAWFDPHKRPDFWRNRASIGTKGMRDLTDLGVRAQVCAGCHVGAPPSDDNRVPVRDMNHDLIAAGHPRLNFEFAAFLANLPKHWKEKDTEPGFESRAWAIGQVATAKAALELLAHRAGPNEPCWPEFSEYDCYSCHHDLTASKEGPGHLSWRQKRSGADRSLGVYSWGSWYYSLVPAALGEGDKTFSSDFKTLQKAMKKTYPNRDAVAQQATSLAGNLGAWLTNADGKALNAATFNNLRGRLAGPDQKLVPIEEWDAATQVYLALMALNADAPDEKLAGELVKMREKLLSQDKFEGVSGFMLDGKTR